MLNDNELIAKFQDGDEKAFDQLVQNNVNNVFGFFMKVTRNEMTAEDLAQDVFMKLYKNLKNFRHDSNFSTYLYRINTNTVNSWITRNKWKNLLHLDQAPDRGEYDQVNEVEWERKELWASISKLPKKQREVVILRLTNELSFREVSKITGMKEGTAKVNFHHALKKLKEDLINE
jgi:RNA polymerase sigma-70 factor (ECF subfamily)|tara:strand:+ start:161 stop:685 length:525 start_codon:yes stop_codon:yes gene_type:complete